jgi:hypothetical protein
MTSPLPRGCSTTELAGPIQKFSVVTSDTRTSHSAVLVLLGAGLRPRLRCRERETGFEPATFSLEG